MASIQKQLRSGKSIQLYLSSSSGTSSAELHTFPVLGSTYCAAAPTSDFEVGPPTEDQEEASSHSFAAFFSTEEDDDVLGHFVCNSNQCVSTL